jgi:hypothetical protein
MTWREQAACFGHDPAWWLTWEPATAAKAVAICDGCPVKTQCLEEAMGQSRHEDAGIWGGLTAEERERERARRKGRVERHGTGRGYRRHVQAGEPACTACMQAYLAERARRAS